MPSAARARSNRWARSASSSCSARAMASRTAGGGAGEVAAFELGVVLDADPGERGDLAAAQPGHPAVARGGQAGLLRGDLGSARDEELADLGSVVHAIEGTAARHGRGMPCRYTSRQGLPRGAPAAALHWSRRPRPPIEGEPPCVVSSCTPPATSGSRTRPTRRSSKPTDAIIRLSATCVCGSDLWPYRGIETLDGPTPMGHEYVGIVEEVGSDVTTIRPGQFVVGSFFASDNTCEICRAGYQTSCVHRESDGHHRRPGRAPARPARRRHPGRHPRGARRRPDPELLAASDVLGTGWFGAVAAEAGPGKTVAVVGDGAVGLLARARRQAARRRAHHRHEPARDRGRSWPSSSAPPTSSPSAATTASREIKELTDGLGAHSVIEAVGTQESMHAGDPLHPPRRPRRLRRRHPRRRAPRRRSCSSRHVAPARRPRPGPPLPARPDRPDLATARSTPARSSTSPCPSTRPPRATGPWTSAAPSRCCCARDRPSREGAVDIPSHHGAGEAAHSRTRSRPDLPCRLRQLR